LSSSSITTGLVSLLVLIPVAAGEGMQAELDFSSHVGIGDARNRSV
jgi:hypothetical protein